MRSDLGRLPDITAKPGFEEDGKICVLSVKLAPGTVYSLGINSERYTGFRRAANPEDVVTPYLLTFTTSGEGPATKSATERWQEDLAFLATTLPARHKNLFFHLPEAQFRKEVDDLNRRIPDLKENQIAVEMMKLVASLGDAHTRLELWPPLRDNILPLDFDRFPDGWYVISADQPHQSLLGARLSRLGDSNITTVTNTLAQLIPHENEPHVQATIPQLLVFPRVLVALGLLKDSAAVPLTLITRAGKTITVKVPAPASRPKLLPAYDPDKEQAPLYLAKRKLAYWAGYVPNGDLIYVLYNRCENQRDYPIEDLQDDLEALLQAHPQSRAVIDLRRNEGGNSALFEPIIDSLAANPRFAQKGRLFLIIGRHTFSSAVLNAIHLRDRAHALLVGKPTGGKPNQYGEVQAFNLPNSNLVVTYSTKYFAYQEADTPSLRPDLPTELTYADYLAGKDPALEAIRALPSGTIQAILDYRPPR